VLSHPPWPLGALCRSKHIGGNLPQAQLTAPGRFSPCGESRAIGWSSFEQESVAADEMGSHGDDFDEIAERAEIVRIAGVERQAGSARGRCKEEVDGTRPPRFAARGDHSGINPSVSACRLSVEGQRIEGGFRALEPVLAARPLFGVG